MQRKYCAIRPTASAAPASYGDASRAAARLAPGLLPLVWKPLLLGEWILGCSATPQSGLGTRTMDAATRWLRLAQRLLALNFLVTNPAGLLTPTSKWGNLIWLEKIMLTITYSRGSKLLAGAVSLKYRMPVLPDVLLLHRGYSSTVEQRIKVPLVSGSNPVIHN